MRRGSPLGLVVTLSVVLTASPAYALEPVCLGCANGRYLADPFAPLVLGKGQWLLSTSLGAEPPLGKPTLLPGLLLRLGLADGIEFMGNVGYNPAASLTRTFWQTRDGALLGTVAYAYNYFLDEQSGFVSLPVMLPTWGAIVARVEPRYSYNQFSGHHVALGLALAAPVGPATMVTFDAQPDLELAFGDWTGSASIGVSRSLGVGWSAYVAAGGVYVGVLTPVVSTGLTYLPSDGPR